MSQPPAAVELRAIERADLAQLRDWRNALRKNFRQWYPLGMEDQEAWFSRIQSREREVMHAVWADGVLIGVVGLTYIDWRVRKAEASIYIGAAGHRGKGYGKAALEALLYFGFDTAGMHRIYAEIFEDNAESIGLFESCRFAREGTQRDAHFGDGRWQDVRMYGLLEPAWRSGR